MGNKKDKYKKRKAQLKKILENLRVGIKGFIDGEGRIGRHPSRINEFILEDYSWE